MARPCWLTNYESLAKIHISYLSYQLAKQVLIKIWHSDGIKVKCDLSEMSVDCYIIDFFLSTTCHLDLKLELTRKI